MQKTQRNKVGRLLALHAGRRMKYGAALHEAMEGALHDLELIDHIRLEVAPMDDHR